MIHFNRTSEKHWGKWCFFCLVLLCLFGGAAFYLRSELFSKSNPETTNSKEKNSSPPAIELSTNELDLGRIQQGGQTEMNWWIWNHTDSSLEFSSIQTSCPCFSIHPEKKTVLPNEKVKLVVQFDLKEEPEFLGSLLLTAEGSLRSASDNKSYSFKLKTQVVVYKP